MDRRQFLGRMLLTAAPQVLLMGRPWPAIAQAAPQARQPNIVVILADDLAWPDVSAYGQGRSRTPNIDRIGAAGVVFDNAYVAAPVCAVSRAAILTGRYPQRFGFHYNLDDTGNPDDGLPLGEPTIADRLKDLGYRTAAIGKWHEGARPAFYPMRRGFDEFYGFLSGESLYSDPDTPGIVTTRKEGEKPMTPQPSWRTVTGPDAEPVDNGHRYLTFDLTDKAIDFIDRSAGDPAPFFLYMAYNAPHWPFQAPQDYEDRQDPALDPLRRTQLAMIQALDDSVGRLLDTLERRGLRENTLIVFLSDNGCPLQLGACDCTHPFGAGKFTFVEGGIRTPFLVSWPRGMEARGHAKRLASSLDILPTVLKAAAPDRALPALDGIDLLGGAEGTMASRTLFWGQDPVFAARRGRWKLWESSGDRQLFDLEADPAELTDRAASEPEILRDLQEALEQWRDTLAPPLWPRHFVQQGPVCQKTTTWVY